MEFTAPAAGGETLKPSDLEGHLLVPEQLLHRLHDPYCLQINADDNRYGYTTSCKCEWVTSIRTAALRDAVKAVMAYADKTHKHVGMFKCWPESGDRCDITAALRVAVVKIQELGGER